MLDTTILATPSCRPPRSRPASAEEAGTKAAGLLRLPPEWYPPTLIVPTQVHEQVRNSQDRSATLGRLLENAALEERFACLSVDRSEGILVRSSANGETIAERGHYESFGCDATPDALRESILAVWRTAEGRDRSAGEPARDVAAALQPRIIAFASGHLSNEHRVCRDSTNWLVEGLSADATSPPWRVTNAAPAGDGPLTCHELNDLRRQLRAVARRLSDAPYRHHLEWVWDGARLWIVQCDRVPVRVGPSPGELWLPTRGRPVSPTGLQAWRAVPALSNEAVRWQKLECRRAFAAAELPVTEVFALHGAHVISALARGETPDEVVADLDLLCDGHLLVRTDVAADQASFMLPKTEAETDPALVLDWLKEKAAALIAMGADADGVAFIAHRFLRSRACAWSYARPDDPIVMVDATWGLNDGLSWLPHDSAMVDTQSGEVRLSIAGKPTFLDVAQDHHWRHRETPTEWIWRASVTEDQLRTMGRGAHRLAVAQGRPVITMWFVGLLDGADADTLPWFQAPWAPDGDEATARRDPAARRHVIRADVDLEQLPSGDLSRDVLQLRPGDALMRDPSFVDRVAKVSLSRGLGVEIEGSRLAHPYYMLRRHGVAVTTRTLARPPNVEAYNKLVRDQIPDLITQQGEHAVVYRATDAERRGRLRAKAVEEALELLAATTSDEEVAEVADLLEVLDALAATSGWTRNDVEALQAMKRSQRGGFDEGYVLLSTSDGPTRDVRASPEDHEATLPGMPPRAQRRTLLRHVGGALEVSLVPPERGEPRGFRTQLSGRTTHVMYSDATVTVRLEPSPVTAPRDYEQPDLWS